MNMNKLFLLAIAFIVTQNSLKAQENLHIIQSIDVKTDYTYEGVQGVNVIYKYSFFPIEEKYHKNIDSILQDADFLLQTKLLIDNKSITIASGYKTIGNTKNELEDEYSFFAREMYRGTSNKKIERFIPYAALNLSEGKHIISAKGLFSGKDKLGAKYAETVQKDNIEINKPKTHVFTLNIDYIEVNETNAKGNAWDIALFRPDAPDVDANVLIGNTSVWENHVNDTYMFAMGPKSKNISFVISDKDRVTILVQDLDVFFHDFIAKWIFETKDKKAGELNTYEKAGGNIKSCSLSYKVD